jgi:hypothetical protein
MKGKSFLRGEISDLVSYFTHIFDAWFDINITDKILAYDFIFEYEGKTYSELKPEIKVCKSHSFQQSYQV